MSTGYPIGGGLTISEEASDQLLRRGREIGLTAAANEYIKKLDEKWGGDWDEILSNLCRHLRERWYA
jgi:hypothetical protein